MFPAYFFTTLRVTVHHQTVAPECPSSGSFRVFFLNDEPSAFSKVCQQKLLTLRYEDNPAKPMRLRFRDQRGVDVQIGYVGTQFAEGKRTVRADARFAFSVMRPAAFSEVTGI